MTVARDTLLAAIKDAGGIDTLSGYAVTHNISKQRLHVQAQRDDFPEPLCRLGRIDLYLVRELDTFRSTARPAGRRKRSTGSDQNP